MIEFRKIDLNWVKFNFYFFSKINFILKRSNNQLFELKVKYIVIIIWFLNSLILNFFPFIIKIKKKF